MGSIVGQDIQLEGLMGYFLIQHPEPPTVQQLVTAAIMAFQQFHVIEKRPAATVDAVEQTVTVEAGESMTFTWDSLGF